MKPKLQAHLLFNGKTHVKVNSQGGLRIVWLQESYEQYSYKNKKQFLFFILAFVTYLILVIFKLPVLFHGGRGEEIEEGVCLHLKPDNVLFFKQNWVQIIKS